MKKRERYEQGSDYIRYPLTYCWKAHINIELYLIGV